MQTVTKFLIAGIVVVVLIIVIIVILIVTTNANLAVAATTSSANPNANFSFTNFSSQTSGATFLQYPDTVAFLGCFNDAVSGTRVFQNDVYNTLNQQMTVKQCAQYVQGLNAAAGDLGYQYSVIGLQYGGGQSDPGQGQCWYGPPEQYDRFGPTTCTLYDINGYPVGGANVNAVYALLPAAGNIYH